jgi:hypothetical protein
MKSDLFIGIIAFGVPIGLAALCVIMAILG